MLPRGHGQIDLLTPVEGFKKRLRKLNLKVARETKEIEKVTSLPHHSFLVKNPTKEIRVIIYIFYEGKLVGMQIEYNMRTFKENYNLDFDRFLIGFKNKYGEPVEIEDRSFLALGLKMLAYRWKDEKTLLQLTMSPPGKEPISQRGTLGAIQLLLHDKELKRKYNQDIWENLYPKVREGLEKERRFIKKDPSPDRMIWFK